MTFFVGTPDGRGSHDQIAAKIAAQGKEWARLHWRKEDMASYMYRLVLGELEIPLKVHGDCDTDSSQPQNGYACCIVWMMLIGTMSSNSLAITLHLRVLSQARHGRRSLQSGSFMHVLSVIACTDRILKICSASGGL